MSRGGQFDAPGAKRTHASRSIQGHEGRAGRPAGGSSFGLSLPAPRPQLARIAGHGVSEQEEGDLRPWLLLARPCVQAWADAEVSRELLVGKD